MICRPSIPRDQEMIDTVGIGASAHHDAMAFEFGQGEIAEGIGETDDGSKVGDAAFLEGFDHAGIFLHDFVQFVEIH